MDPDATLLTDGQPARVLVVDDELLIRSGLAQALSLSGYAADVADCGEEALAKLESTSYDVMVLDLQMPGIHGVEVMQRAQAMWPHLSIIILTGHATLDSAICAVKSEAVDYLLKPVSVHQVIETITRVLHQRAEERRQQRLVQTITTAVDTLQRIGPRPVLSLAPDPSPPESLHVHPLTLDVQRQTVVVEDEDQTRTASLTGSETAVLAALMIYSGQVFSCRQLAHRALDYDTDEFAAQSTIRPILFRLRRKIEANSRQPRLILTVRGRGYFLAPAGP